MFPTIHKIVEDIVSISLSVIRFQMLPFCRDTDQRNKSRDYTVPVEFPGKYPLSENGSLKIESREILRLRQVYCDLFIFVIIFVISLISLFMLQNFALML